MPSQLFLVSNFRTGIDRQLEPWLTMDDAIVDSNNYRLQRGVLQTRRGISGFAQGGRSTAQNEQSRIYTTTTGETVTDAQATFIHTLACPVRPGSVTFNESGGDTATDDGTGGFTGDFDSGATIDYNTGVVSATWTNGTPTTPTIDYTHANASVKVTNEDVADTGTISGNLANTKVRRGSVVFWDGGTQYAYDDGAGGFTGDISAGSITYSDGSYSLTWNVASGSDAKVSYAYKTNNPVMGIFNFITSNNTRELIVVSTDEFNKYNATLNRFDPMTLTGSGTSDPTGGVTQYFSGTMYPDKTSSPRLVMVNDNAADRIYVYNGTNINRFQNGADFGDVSNGAGQPYAAGLATGLHVFYFNERLVIIRPRDTAGTSYPHRIQWTGIVDGSGNGDDFNAPGSGYLDIPTQFFITAATKLRNAIIIFTTENVWELTTTDDIDLPFRIKQIGDAEARGAQAPFSGITWFGESAAVGHFGIVGTDSRESFRIDNKIPFFTRDRMIGLSSSLTINPMELINTGTVFEDDQFWWLYADVNSVSTDLNSNVLAYNFVEESWAIYDLGLSCMGKFQQTDEIVWDDVTGAIKDSWTAWDTTSEIWDSFFSQQYVFFTLCGDAFGFIYNLIDQNDQCANISNITQANPAVITTEPDKFNVGDRVTLNAVAGMTEVNGQTYTVTAVTDGEVTIGTDSTDFTAYSSGGIVCKNIAREAKFKPFNPFVKDNKKCRLKKIHLFYDTDKTSLLIDFFADRRETAYRQDVQVDDGTNEGNATKKWTSISVNQVANFHSIRIHQEQGDANERLHAIIYECEPTGRLYR